MRKSSEGITRTNRSISPMEIFIRYHCRWCPLPPGNSSPVFRNNSSSLPSVILFSTAFISSRSSWTVREPKMSPTRPPTTSNLARTSSSEKSACTLSRNSSSSYKVQGPMISTFVFWLNVKVGVHECGLSASAFGAHDLPLRWVADNLRPWTKKPRAIIAPQPPCMLYAVVSESKPAQVTSLVNRRFPLTQKFVKQEKGKLGLAHERRAGDEEVGALGISVDDVPQLNVTLPNEIFPFCCVSDEIAGMRQLNHFSRKFGLKKRFVKLFQARLGATCEREHGHARTKTFIASARTNTVKTITGLSLPEMPVNGIKNHDVTKTHMSGQYGTTVYGTGECKAADNRSAELHSKWDPAGVRSDRFCNRLKLRQPSCQTGA